MGVFISVLRWAAVATGLIPASGRKKYRVTILDEEVGTFELPFSVAESVTRTPNGPPGRRLLTRPFREQLFDNPLYYWVEPAAGGKTEVVLWEATGADEVAEADRFFAAAHGLTAAGGPRPGKARPLARRSDDEQRLIDATRADPDADGPFLDYAAWLTAKGDPRGEFVRLTVELNRLPAADPGRDKLETRRAKLLDKHGPRWMKPLTDLGFFPGILFPLIVKTFYPDLWLDKKGVVVHLDIDRAGVFPANAERFFSAVPFLRSLSLSYNSGDPALADFAAMPGLAQLDALSLHRAETTEESILAFAQSPHLARLRSLDLTYTRLGPEGGLYLGQSPSLGQLRTLKLGWGEIGDDGVRALAGSAVCGNLRDLDVSSNGLTDAGLAAVAGSPHLAHLTALKLESNAFTAAGVAALGGAAFRPTLTRLNLGGCGLDAAAAAALAGVELPALTSLTVANNTLGEGGFRALVGAAFFSPLQVFEAWYTGAGDAGALALAAVGFTALRELVLDNNAIGDRGVAALVESPAVAGLRKLSLLGNTFGAAGARAIAASTTLAELLELDLRDAPIGEAGAAALARSPHLRKLTRLMVAKEHVGDAGETALRRRFTDDVVSFL